MKTTDTKNFIVFSLLPSTPLVPDFLSALEVFAEENFCQILAIPQRYRIPTTKESDVKQKREEWYPDSAEQYMSDGDLSAYDGKLEILGDHQVSATTNNPLSAVLTGQGKVSVLGHAKLFIQTLPRYGDGMPGVRLTTGSVSTRNYSNSTAGHRSHTHHSIRALAILDAGDGEFNMRHLAWDGEKIMDLSGIYYPDRFEPDVNTVRLVQLADIHAGSARQSDMERLYEWLDWLQPGTILCGDLLDWERYSHHNMKRLDWRSLNHPANEMRKVTEFFSNMPLNSKIVVQESNHHDHMAQWIERWQKPQSYGELLDFHEYLNHYVEAQGRDVTMFQVALEKLGWDDLEYSASYFSGERQYTHGHEGYRGTGITQRARFAYPTSAGHNHTPARIHHALTTGVMARPSSMEYIGHSTTSWAIAHTVEYHNGKAELIYQRYID